MTKKQALSIASSVGGFSSPSKMPCHSFSIPATKCAVGGQLNKVAGSVCSKCYARKGRYVFPNVRKAQERRFALLNAPEWAERLAAAINGLGEGFFRWHDSGDLQGEWHLRNILEVAQKTPGTLHWIPTKEYGLMHRAVRDGLRIPENVTVRVSSPMVDTKPPRVAGLPTSTVTTNPEAATCRAFKNAGKCGDCRACWDRSIGNICYLAH